MPLPDSVKRVVAAILLNRIDKPLAGGTMRQEIECVGAALIVG